MNDIEAIVQKHHGPVSPGMRVTPAALEKLIVREEYHQFPDTMLIVCCLYLSNGYTVTGQSASADPLNFSEQIGREVSRKRAIDNLYPLEGYLIRIALHERETAASGN